MDAKKTRSVLNESPGRFRLGGSLYRTACLIVHLLVFGSAAAQSTSNNTVTIDLTQLTVDKTLPFDTPFSIVGTLPNDVDDVDVVIKTSNSIAACNSFRSPAARPNDCSNLDSGCSLKSTFGLPSGSGDSITKRFAARAPSLVHSTRYAVCVFPRLAKRLDAGTRESLTAAFDRFFWESPVASDIGAIGSTDLKELCEEIKTTVIEKTGATLIPNSPLAKCVSAGLGAVDRRSTFGEQLALVRERQKVVLDIGDDIVDFQKSLETALVFLGTELSSNRARFETALDSWPRASQADKVALVAFAELLSGSKVRNLARGAAISADGSGELLARSTVDVVLTIDRYRELAASLESFKDISNLRDQLPNWDDFRANREAAVDDVNNLRLTSLRLIDYLNARTSAVSALREHSISDRFVTENFLFFAGETFENFTTESQKHVAPDVGFLYAWDLEEALPYFGANFYTRPINRDVPLSQIEQGGNYSFRHRFSFTIGVTVNSIEKDNQREGVIGENALVLGVGLRITDVIRLNGGALVFREFDSNPLSSDRSIAVSPYVGLSWDVELNKVFTGFKSLFGQ